MYLVLASSTSAIRSAALLGLDWHSHHSSRSAEFDSAVVEIITAIAVALVCGLGFVLAGLVEGGLLLALLGKKRHLFWVVPALNGGLYFPMRAYLLPDAGPLSYALLGVPLALLCGLLAAALLAPLQILWRRLRDTSDGFRPGTGGPTALATAPLVPVDLKPPPANESKLAAFRRGLAAPWEGFRYLCFYPRLWRYGLVPVVINLLITGVVLVLLLAAAVAFFVYLHPLFPPGWGWVVLEVLCGIGLLVLAVGLALVLWAFLQGVLCGHFNTQLARAVEIQLGLRPEQIHDVSWSYQAADAGRDAAALVLINGGFLLLHLVPAVGSVVGTAGSLYFDWLLFGAEYFDYPLALRGKRRSEKKDFFRKHRCPTLGLGATVFLANFVPVVGSVLLTTAVVGAVLLHRRLESPDKEAQEPKDYGHPKSTPVNPNTDS